MDAGTGAGPGRRRFVIEAPYVRPKFHLLTGMARANHCETVLHTATDEATIVGYGSDVDAVLVLYTSLLVQGTAAMLAEGSAADRAGRSRTRSFRHAFWLSFGQRIGSDSRRHRHGRGVGRHGDAGGPAGAGASRRAGGGGAAQRLRSTAVDPGLRVERGRHRRRPSRRGACRPRRPTAARSVTPARRTVGA
ncbi:MAG: hypothetical protein R2690_15740 [Acidimicrobiales bacterium]